jgi:transglutaminase-like putative cysteine protease
MTLARTGLLLRAVTYLLVATGVLALVLGGLLGPLGAALVAAAVAATWWLEAARRSGRIRPAVVLSVVGVAALAVAVDLAYLAASVLDGMVHLLLVLILVRLLLCRSLRDLREAGFLSFFMLVAASTVTFSIAFLALFVAFLVLGTWMLLLHHVQAEAEAAGRGPDAPAVIAVPTLLRVGAAGAAVTLVIAAGLFFLIPRVGQAMLPFRSQLTRVVTGFSDRVDLGSFGDIEADRTVVMRVYLPAETDDPTGLPNLRWRGVVFDHFDGRTWAAGRAGRDVERRGDGGRFLLAPPRGRGPIVRQEIFLEPMGTEVVFAAPRPIRMYLRAGTLLLDDTGSVSVPTAAARLQYSVESELEVPVPPGTRVAGAGATLSPGERARYLQLPPLGPAVTRLAAEVTARSRDPYETASRLTAFLSSPAFRYTLAKPETTRQPLEEFLLARRSGNCEYFAAALAVMLRTQGIPARVVGGFQRGEWNPYGGYFMVRLADAHSWVEAHFDGLGWITLDPSPRGLGEGAGAPWAAALYLDAVRMRWYRYVINWSLQDQRVVAAGVARQARDLGQLFAWRGEWPGRGWLAAPAALALLAAFWAGLRTGGIRGLLLALGRAPRALARRAGGDGVPRFYARALRALARRGLRPEPWETARQFCSRAAAALPGVRAPLEQLTRQYERARFGGRALERGQLEEAERLLAQIEAR